MDLVIVNKSRDLNNICSMNEVIGEVDGKDCVIIDDIVDGASTICMATELLINKGAKSVCAIVTHAVLSNDAMKKIEHSKISKIHITDSISHNKLTNKFTVTPTHKLIGSVVREGLGI